VASHDRMTVSNEVKVCRKKR